MSAADRSEVGDADGRCWFGSLVVAHQLDQHVLGHVEDRHVQHNVRSDSNIYNKNNSFVLLIYTHVEMVTGDHLLIVVYFEVADLWLIFAIRSVKQNKYRQMSLQFRLLSIESGVTYACACFVL